MRKHLLSIGCALVALAIGLPHATAAKAKAKGVAETPLTPAGQKLEARYAEKK